MEAPAVTKKKRSFDATFKLKVIEYAEKNSNRAAARKYDVDDKRVREWRKQKNSLMELPGKKRRLEGAGRKAAYPEMEEELLWEDAEVISTDQYSTNLESQKQEQELLEELKEVLLIH